jgi:phosphatidylinositol 4-kinase
MGGFGDCVMLDDALMFPNAPQSPATQVVNMYGKDAAPPPADLLKRPSLDRMVSETDASDAEGGGSEDEPEPLLFSESWQEKEARIGADSPYSGLPGWRLVPIIVKSYDDLRQEQMVAQLIAGMQNILSEGGVPVRLRAYDIIATQLGGTGGLIEAVPDTASLDSLKRNDPSYTTLDDFFVRHFGKGVKSSSGYRKARRNFVSR